MNDGGDASALEELSSSMVAAERRNPGIVDGFVTELINSMVISSSSLQWTAVDTAVLKTKR